MTRLSIYPEGSTSNTIPSLPLLESSNSAVIKTELESRGIEFQHWPVKVELNEQASEAEILAIYTAVINRVQADGRYPTVDAIRMKPDHPQRERLRQKFLAEHIHAEDEVRFFVEGCGLFCLHINDEVLQVLCEKNDLINVPAETRHWFDMGSKPNFCAVRFFNNPEGWVASFTGDPISERFTNLR
ncbi:MAG: acireductone dioxygenase [Prochlorococcaceae cyanobacterium ETNP18_MAG_14]|nr:acireductone dioxygenase [Prochlorococcaceae cyanobacterium ETNP18_MAG_14]